MELGPLVVCSHGLFMEGNVSSGGPSFLHRRADHGLPGKRSGGRHAEHGAHEPGTAAGWVRPTSIRRPLKSDDIKLMVKA